MAAHLEDQDENVQQPAARQDAPSQAAPATPAASPRFNLNRLSSSLARPLGRNDSGVVLARTAAQFKEFFEDPKNNDPAGELKLKQWHLVPIDHKEHHTTLSVLAIVLPVRLQDGVTALVSHGLILEGSDAALAPSQEEWGGRRFEVTKVAGDIPADQRTFKSRVGDIVTRALAGVDTNVRYIDAGFQVLASEVDITEEAAVRNFAFYATNACTTLASELFGLQEPFTLAGAAEQGVSLEISPEFNVDGVTTVNGFPRRTDARLRVSANVRREDNVNDRIALTDVGVQIGLVFSPPQNAVGFNSFGQQQQDTRHYLPWIEINRLDTETRAITMEMQCLGLLSASILTQDLYWLNAFRVNRQIDLKDDMRDVGALALAVHTERAPTRGSDFDDSQWRQLMGNLCHEDVIVGMTIEEAGELSWMNSVFVSAAAGEIEMGKLIWKAMDNLTGGQFGQRLPLTDEVLRRNLILRDNRIIDGYYEDNRGERRDLREFDFLYILNATGNISQALDYQDTFDNADNQPLAARLNRREQIIRDLLGHNNVKVKGYSHQLIIGSEFLNAAAASIEGIGLHIDRSRSSFAYGKTRVRGNTDLIGMAQHNVGQGLFASRRPMANLQGGRGSQGHNPRGTW